MSYNGAGLFLINTAGQPVVGNTLIDSTVFNALTADIATGLTTCLTKDGQTTPTANIPMGGFKITGMGLATAVTDAASLQNIYNAAVRGTCNFRLTLTSGTPVTTADVTGATTIYLSPIGGNSIALYDGTNWIMYSSAEMSLTNAGVGGALPTDVFCYASGGVPTMEFSQWTNDTTRATALTLQNGVLVKSGATTRRYVGTFRSTAGGAFTDSYTNRWVWNYYNRRRRPMRALEATDSWNYTTATLRQANASTANQLDFVVGVDEELVSAEVYAFYNNSTAGVGAFVAIGLDSTTTKATGCVSPSPANGGVNYFALATSALKTFPGVGRHTMVWLEYSAAIGATTWFGDNGAPAVSQSGIHGEIFA